MYKRIATVSIILIMFAFLASSAYCQNAAPQELKIGMEVNNISKFDLMTGKYSAEIGVYVSYPDIDLPVALDIDEFYDSIYNKLKDKESQDQLLKYYEEDEENYMYLLKEDIKDEDKLALYDLIKSTGYYDKLLPFAISNGKIEKDEKEGKEKIDRYELDPEDPTLIYYKINAEISSSLDFKDFPFDSQDISIKLESVDDIKTTVFKPMEDLIMLPEQIKSKLFDSAIAAKLTPDKKDIVLKAYQLNPEKTYYEIKDNVSKEDEKKIKEILNSIEFNTLISPGVKIAGWKVREGVPSIGKDSYFGEKFSTFTFPITISRNAFSSFMKIFVPLIFMILITFMSLFVGTSVIGNRLTILSGLLLACVMLHLNCTSSLPGAGGYLNLADKFFICSYASIFINLLLTVFIINRNEKKDEKGVKTSLVTAMWLVPLLTVLLYALVALGVF